MSSWFSYPMQSIIIVKQLRSRLIFWSKGLLISIHLALQLRIESLPICICWARRSWWTKVWWSPWLPHRSETAASSTSQPKKETTSWVISRTRASSYRKPLLLICLNFFDPSRRTNHSQMPFYPFLLYPLDCQPLYHSLHLQIHSSCSVSYSPIYSWLYSSDTTLLVEKSWPTYPWSSPQSAVLQFNPKVSLILLWCCYLPRSALAHQNIWKS